MEADPYSPEWTIEYTLRRALRSKLKSKNEELMGGLAREVIAALRLCGWHLVKRPMNSGWEFDPAAIELRQERQRAFDQKLRELNDLAGEAHHLPSEDLGDGQ